MSICPFCLRMLKNTLEILATHIHMYHTKSQVYLSFLFQDILDHTGNPSYPYLHVSHQILCLLCYSYITSVMLLFLHETESSVITINNVTQVLVLH